MFNIFNQNHDYSTRAANKYVLDLPPIKTTRYGWHSMKSKASEIWKNSQQIFIEDPINCNFTELKKTVFEMQFNKYSTLMLNI